MKQCIHNNIGFCQTCCTGQQKSQVSIALAKLGAILDRIKAEANPDEPPPKVADKFSERATDVCKQISIDFSQIEAQQAGRSVWEAWKVGVQIEESERTKGGIW